MSIELVPPGEHLAAVFTLVRQDPGVEGALVDLEVGLGGECLITEPALVVPPPLVDDLDMGLKLQPRGEQLAAHVTREQLLGYSLSLGVDTVFPCPEIKLFSLDSCV